MSELRGAIVGMADHYRDRITELEAELAAAKAQIAEEKERADGNYASADRIRTKYSDCWNELKAAKAEIAKLRLALDPGKAPAIIAVMFELAERECGSSPVSSKHALSHVADWIAAAKAENQRLAEHACRMMDLVSSVCDERDKLRAALEAVFPVIAMVLKHREATMPEVVSKLMAAFEELSSIVGNALGGRDA